MRILYPTPKLEDYINHFWPSLISRLGSVPEKGALGGIRNWIDKARKLRMLCPDGINQMNLTDSDWSIFTDILEQFKKRRRWGEVLKITYGMLILAAEDVRVSSGLELVLPQHEKALTVSIPSMPEQRRF